MKKILRFIIYASGTVLLLILGFVAFLQIRGIPKYEVKPIEFAQVQGDSAMIAHGAKLAAVQCMVCHRGSDGKLSGRKLEELPPDFGEVHSANITQSVEHGIGKWTDAQLAYFIRTGVKPDGQFVPPYMPRYPHMSDYDLQCVLAWLHSDNPMVQASETPKVPSKPSLLTKFLCLVAFKEIPYPSKPIAEPDTNDLVAYGRYLVVGRYDCYPCHSADFKKMNQAEPEKSEGYCGGGNMMVALDGKARYTANITMDEETGLGTWTLDDFAKALREAKNKDGHTLRDPMLPYNGLTDLEVKAMWEYLRSIPVIKNKVERNWDEG